MIQGANFDSSVVNALAGGSKAIKELNKKMDVADLDELQDEMAD